MDHTVAGTRETSYSLLIISISLAMFMGSLDGTIVNIALPAISESFNISTTTVSWVATSYLLVVVGCVLIFGKISDMIGFKRIFLAGFALFTFGSFLCGFLPGFFGGFVSLVGSRMVQAVGGAMMMAVAVAMITTYIPADKQGKAMSIVMLFAALGTALGPTIGGILTQYLTWHWIFFINVPVGIIAILLGAKVIPAPGRLLQPTGFDRFGAGLAFAALASLVFVVSEGESFGWLSPVILGLAAVTLAALVLFIRHELAEPDPLLDLRLFWNRNFIIINGLFTLLFFSFSGVNYLIPFYLKYVRLDDTSTAGFILTSLSLAMMIAGIIAGALFNRLGPRRLSIMAAVPLTTGYFMMTRLHAGTTTGYVVASLFLIGFGLGLMVTPVNNLIMISVAKAKAGMISSLTTLERMAPLSVGIAAFNLIFITGVMSVAANRDVTMQSPAEMRMQVLSAGFDLAFFFTFVIGLIIIVMAFSMKEEIHPDYSGTDNEIEPAAGII